jgi:hypothetical protein
MIVLDAASNCNREIDGWLRGSGVRQGMPTADIRFVLHSAAIVRSSGAWAPRAQTFYRKLPLSFSNYGN